MAGRHQVGSCSLADYDSPQIFLIKIYDCSPLLDDNKFKPLLNDALFNSVQVDNHGYGIVWNDELDLVESELWSNGLPADWVIKR
jgi:hypothetical protein